MRWTNFPPAKRTAQISKGMAKSTMQGAQITALLFGRIPIANP